MPLGKPPLDPTEPLDCGLVRRLERQGEVIAAIRPRPAMIDVAVDTELPPGWYRSGADPRMLEIHKGGELPIGSTGTGGRLWIRGRTTRAERLVGLEVTRSPQRVSEWIQIGTTTGDTQLTLERPKRSLRPGDAQPDIVGPIAVVANRRPVLARGAQLRQACGAPADWIDVIRR